MNKTGRNTKMKKLISLTLVLSLILSSTLVIACTGTDVGKPATSSATTGAEVTTNEGSNYYPEISDEPQTEYLMPYWMEAQRFEKMILAPMAEQAHEYDYRHFSSFYSLYDPNDEINKSFETVIEQMAQDYPCTAKVYYTASESYTVINKLYQEELRNYNVGDKMAIYVIAPYALTSEEDINLIVSYIKKYCPEYTYKEQNIDIFLTGYPVEELNKTDKPAEPDVPDTADKTAAPDEPTTPGTAGAAKINGAITFTAFVCGTNDKALKKTQLQSLPPKFSRLTV